MKICRINERFFCCFYGSALALALYHKCCYVQSVFLIVQTWTVTCRSLDVLGPFVITWMSNWCPLVVLLVGPFLGRYSTDPFLVSVMNVMVVHLSPKQLLCNTFQTLFFYNDVDNYNKGMYRCRLFLSAINLSFSSIGGMRMKELNNFEGSNCFCRFYRTWSTVLT